jgi:hypothetical protein
MLECYIQITYLAQTHKKIMNITIKDVYANDLAIASKQ